MISSDFLLGYGAAKGSEPKGYELLASGEYTLAADSATMTIPVTYTGTPKSFYVEIQSGGTKTGTWAWCRMNDTKDICGEQFQTLWMGRQGTSGTRTVLLSAPTISETELKVPRANTNSTIKAGTYNYYIYGVKE